MNADKEEKKRVAHTCHCEGTAIRESSLYKLPEAMSMDGQVPRRTWMSGSGQSFDDIIP
jgi:hypothetical protein